MADYNEISNYNLEKKLIFKKYRVGKLIYKSNLSTIHEGINELNGEQVALKFEKTGQKYNLLESEACFLFLLKGEGIPKIISYGKIIGFKVIIEELLGESIYLLWKNKTFDIKNKINDLCLIAIQCLDRLKYIHSKNTVHRDIKPLNFLFGKKNPNFIYLIDFGIAKKYRSSRTGKHIKYKFTKKVNGSLRYMSINSNKFYEQSRRDDLESLGYTLIYLIKKTLPWINIEKLNIDKIEKYRKVRDLKISTLPEELCSGLPKEFCDYIKYCRNLTFEQEPNYNYLKNLFLEIVKKNEKIRDLNSIGRIEFSWFKKDSITIGSIGSYNSYNSHRHNQSQISGLRTDDLSIGKENTHKRLYSQIKNSKEKVKSKQIPKIKRNNIFKIKLKNINLIVNNKITIGGNIISNYSIENNYINTQTNENIKKNNIFFNNVLTKTNKEKNNDRNKLNDFIKKRNVKPFLGMKKINRAKRRSECISYFNTEPKYRIQNSIFLKNNHYHSLLSKKSLNLNIKRYYKTLKEREEVEEKNIDSNTFFGKKYGLSKIKKFKKSSLLISVLDNAI